jgi:hypothetical protein
MGRYRLLLVGGQEHGGHLLHEHLHVCGVLHQHLVQLGGLLILTSNFKLLSPAGLTGTGGSIWVVMDGEGLHVLLVLLLLLFITWLLLML